MQRKTHLANAVLGDVYKHTRAWIDWIQENCIGDKKSLQKEEFKQVVSQWLFDYYNTHYGEGTKLTSFPMLPPGELKELKEFYGQYNQ